MFYWGQDIIHQDSNLLLDEGFQRDSSRARGGLKGSSCYRKAWQGGRLELYGSCAGWYGEHGGFTFIRPQRRCVIWKSATETPIPGIWQPNCIATNTAREELYYASHPLLDWLISYEHTILNRYGHEYRLETYKRYQKVPKAKAWIEPSTALEWFQCFRHTPELLDTPKRFAAA